LADVSGWGTVDTDASSSSPSSSSSSPSEVQIRDWYAVSHSASPQWVTENRLYIIILCVKMTRKSGCRAGHLVAAMAEGGVAAITAGERPAWLARRCAVAAATADGDGGAHAVTAPVVTRHPVPVHDGDIVDTNGCGDAFEGGFLAAAVVRHFHHNLPQVGVRLGPLFTF
jgi:hypothetical protein